MSSIQEILASILQAVYGKDVRQAIHDGVEMAYIKADNAEISAAAAAEAASGSQNSAAASAQAAANSASSASDSADLAEQYKNEAFHTTPAGYEAFVGEVNSSLGYFAETGKKNILPFPYYDMPTGGIFVVNRDGTITINGTPSSNINVRISRAATMFAPPAGKYIISKGFAQTGVTFFMQAYNGDTFVKNLNTSDDDNVEVTIDYVDYDRIIAYIQVNANVSVNNQKAYPMMRLVGTSSKYQTPNVQTNKDLSVNYLGDRVGLSLNTPYTAPHDGYVELYCAGISKITLKVTSGSGGVYNFIAFLTTEGSQLIFVKKGMIMEIIVNASGSGNSAGYRPLGN